MRVRISLTEQNFRDLVAGKIVKPENFSIAKDTHDQFVEVILQDIGWDRIYAAIDDAFGHGERS